MVYLKCINCKTRLTEFVTHSEKSEIWERYTDFYEKNLVEVGLYFQNPDGDYIINIEDKRSIFYHKDPTRLIGCCGPSESDSPNLVCMCHFEVGREVSDCLSPIYIRLLKDKIEVVSDKWKIFESMKHLEKTNPYSVVLSTIENLIKYGGDVEIREYINQHFKE